MMALFKNWQNTKNIEGIVDETGFIVMDSFIHHMIHRGLVFSADGYAAAVQALTPKLWKILTGTSELHFSIYLTALGGAATIKVYEAPGMGTEPEVGTEILFINKNRTKTNTLLSEFYKDPVLGVGGDLGTAIITKAIPGGVGSAANARIGGDSETRSEWIFKPSTIYIIQATAAVNDVDILIDINDAYEVA